MDMHNFVHLNVHSHYSLLQSTATINDIVYTARRLNMPAIALTDHGRLFGAIEFYREAEKHGIKPLLGFITYVSPYDLDLKIKGPIFHLVLLARNNKGFRNLVKLSTISNTQGFYYKPRVNLELLNKYSEGLIALSGSLAGEVPALLLKNEKDEAIKAVKRYQEIFGKENFFVEIQNHGIPQQQMILEDLVDIARKCKAPIAATNNCYYAEPDDWQAHDALTCVGQNAQIHDKYRMRFPPAGFCIKSYQEMAKLFADHPEAISNTLRIAERCNVQLNLENTVLTRLDLPGSKASKSLTMPEVNIPESKSNEKGSQVRLAGIACFKVFRPKIVIQDIGKVLAMKSSEVKHIAGLVPEKPGENLNTIIQEVPELRQIMKSGTKQQQKLLSIASKIDGLVESVQVHSASRLLLSNDSMDVIPLYRDTECEMVSQYGIKSLEALGLIKNDNCKNLTLYQLKSIASTIVE